MTLTKLLNLKQKTRHLKKNGKRTTKLQVFKFKT